MEKPFEKKMKMDEEEIQVEGEEKRSEVFFAEQPKSGIGSLCLYGVEFIVKRLCGCRCDDEGRKHSTLRTSYFPIGFF